MAASSGDGSVDRGDGRTNNQLRPLACELGLLHRADGSARFSHGGTSVLVAVNGPGGVGVRDEKPDRATVQVVWKPKSGLAGIAERQMEQQLAHCLSACISTRDHPRSSITIVVQEMSDDGALLACAVNAACVALMEAGVPLRCCVAAVHVAVPVEGGLAIDPTTAETTAATGSLTFGVTNATADGATEAEAADVVLSATRGAFTPDQCQSSLVVARAAAKSVFAFYRKSLERRLSKDAYIARQMNA